jgi:hypothetical protein
VRRGLGLAAGFLLLSCGSSATPPPAPPVAAATAPSASAAPAPPAPAASATPATDAATARENRRIEKMMHRVAEARQLAAKKKVPGVVLARDALIAKVRAHVDREVPPEAIEQEGLELKLLGFIATDMDYLGETFKLLEAQLAGFYEPADGTMYMAADLDGDNAEATLAHELDHALQDQWFGLAEHSKYTPGKSDVQGAFSALAEGDATSAMFDAFIAKRNPGLTALALPDDAFEETVRSSVNSGAGASAPHIMQTSLVAPYVYGTRFVNTLRRSGGWDAVDEAWKDLPTTTEQVLHPGKWRAHEPAIAVKAPTFAALGAGWRQVDEDSNGELGMRLAFEEWMGAASAAKAAEGWGGDRAVLLRNGAATALAMRTRYDASGPARGKGEDPFVLLAEGLAKTVGKPAARDAKWVCVERPKLGPIAALKKDRDLVLVVGPATSGTAWASAGDCKQAKAWAEEIAAQRD